MILFGIDTFIYDCQIINETLTKNSYIKATEVLL